MSRARHFSADPEPDDDWPPRRRRSRRTKRSFGQRLLLTIGATIVVLCLSAVSLGGYMLVKYASIDRVTGLGTDAAPPGDSQNILLVGDDSRDGLEGRRSDTIMVLRVNPKDERADLISFPRDLIVPLADTGKPAMINAAYSKPDGEKVLIDTIRQNFGIPIHHYVEIDFEAFKQLVDAVGGVPLWFPHAVQDRQSALFVEDLGCVTLDGEMALNFARSRKLQYMTDAGWKDDPRSDLSRVARQQVFLKRAAAKSLSQVKSNPLRLNQLVDIGVDNVRLSDSLGLSDILDLANDFKGVGVEGLETHTLPTFEHPNNKNRLALDKRNAEPVLNIFRGLDPSEISPGLVELTVLNGTDTDGLARDVAGAFAVVGFDVQTPGNVPEDERPDRTVVYHSPKGKDYGLRVARHITGGADLAEKPGLAESEVEVVLGADFETVHDQPTPVEKMTDTSVAESSTSTDNTEASVSDDAEMSPPTVPSTPTTTAPPATTTTTAPPAIVGEPPANASC